jgi:tRNA-modifying protein YgfZ
VPALSPFATAEHYRPLEFVTCRGAALAAWFEDPPIEYRRAREGVVLFDRSDRGLLEVRGRERKEWLHNLVTNTVKTLDDGMGVYAFACNVKGRVLFDLNILVLPESLWLDIDREALAGASDHLSRYLIHENVQIADTSGAWARLGLCGPRLADVAARLGVRNFAALPALATIRMPGGAGLAARHDFAGPPGLDLLVPFSFAARWWDQLVAWGAVPAGFRTLDALRIEAGLPWLGRDIDDSVLPPETGQIERGISYVKGCYLGQEVIERMRSHGALAKRLVRLQVETSAGLVLPTPLRIGEREVGRVTSLVPHPIERYWVGLGYVKTSVTDFAGTTVGEPGHDVVVLT